MGDVPIPYTELEQLTCAELTIVRSLNVVDLRDDCPVKMGVPTAAVRASNNRLGSAPPAEIRLSHSAAVREVFVFDLKAVFFQK